MFVEGKVKYSPSSQCRVNAIGKPVSISTHDRSIGRSERTGFYRLHFSS